MIVSSPPILVDTARYFQEWSTAKLHGYQTRNQWSLEDRKPIKGEKASAFFIDLEHIEEFHRKLGVGLVDVIDYNGHEYRVTARIPLFHQSQTRPAKIQQRTKDYVHFSRLYNLSLHKYIENQDHWKHHRSQELFESEPWKQNFFGVSKIKRHINGLEVLGGFAGDRVKVCYLDLDLHKGESASVFLDGVRVILAAIPELLQDLHGSRLHFQIADRDAAGIHVGFLLDQPSESEDMAAAVRLWLGELADRHHELHEAWITSGFRPWIKTEVFPCKTNGFRLPLCRGRTMLVDRPLVLLPNGKQDLCAFMAFLNGTTPTMPTDNVVKYLAERLKTPDPAPAKVNQQGPTKTGPRLATPKPDTLSQKTRIIWKGRTRPTLVRFWLGHYNPKGSLNEVLAVNCRLATLFLPEQEERAAECLDTFVKELPEHAWACSSRLERQDWATISNDLHRILSRAYKGTLKQKYEHESAQKLNLVASHWRSIGFNPFDKTTWHQTEEKVKLVIDWTEKDIADFQVLRHHFGRARDIAPVTLVNRCVELVIRKEQENKPIALNYWQIFFEDRFGLACRDTGNRKHQRLVQELIELGIMAVTHKHIYTTHKATKYDVGRRVYERKGWSLHPLTFEEQLERVLAA
ncbi:MAG: hypothetical protein HYX68_13945 [Planctomycetes bacterium]|nr:hypothetical protein [Planctomycetota bacterium]